MRLRWDFNPNVNATGRFPDLGLCVRRPKWGRGAARGRRSDPSGPVLRHLVHLKVSRNISIAAIIKFRRNSAHDSPRSDSVGGFLSKGLPVARRFERRNESPAPSFGVSPWTCDGARRRRLKHGLAGLVPAMPGHTVAVL